MEDEIKQKRLQAVQRFRNGESPNTICASLGMSKAWLYKWVGRYLSGDHAWNESRSRRPGSCPTHTPIEIDEIVKMIRLNLYNQDLFCGAQAILWEMEDLGVEPLPSLRTINRILSRNELTHRRTGKYEAKGTVYPKLPSVAEPNPSGRSGRDMLPERADTFLQPECHRYGNRPMWFVSGYLQVRPSNH
jgi:hypothetical protein